MMRHRTDSHTSFDKPQLPPRLSSIVLAPVVWAIHFLACYLTAAIWCEKYADAGSGSGPLLWAAAVYTAIALLLIGYVAWASCRNFSNGSSLVAEDSTQPEDRTKFLRLTTLLLAALSGVATIFTALVFALVRNCH